MAINHDEYKKALKILSENPRKIETERARYNARMEEIKSKERTGNWSPNALKKEREKALEERDRICHTLVHSMRSALETVKANNDYTGESIDLDNKKLQTALNMISVMGKGMQYTDQLNIINQFRGDPASLRVLQAAFAKDGKKWASDYAKDMQKHISEQAIGEMEIVLSFHDYAERQGKFDFPIERAMWSKHEFTDQATRFGYDLGAVADPYILALDDTMRELTNMELSCDVTDAESARKKAEITAKKLKVALCREEVVKALNSGEDPAAAFNKAMRKAEEEPAKPAPQSSGESIDEFLADAN